MFYTHLLPPNYFKNLRNEVKNIFLRLFDLLRQFLPVLDGKRYPVER